MRYNNIHRQQEEWNLSPKQMRSLQNHIQGYSIRESAEMEGLKFVSVSRAKNSPEGRQYTQLLIQESAQVFAEKLPEIINQSLAIIQEMLTSPNPGRRDTGAMFVLRYLAPNLMDHLKGNETQTENQPIDVTPT
ncbi:MAG: hypothetical protein QX195_12530 [Methylococcaceae bacterium]